MTNPRITDGKIPSTSVPAAEVGYRLPGKIGYHEDVEMGQAPDRQSATSIARIVQRIVESFAPEKIILFGSRARGEAHPESDVDLLVLFPEIDDARHRAADLYRLLSGAGVPKDIIVSTTARFERYKNVPNTIYWPAAREGRVLYERPA